MADVSEALRKKIAGKKIIWFGTRGIDALPLFNLSDDIDVISLISPIDSKESCLEYFTKSRMDLNTYTIDDDKSDEAIRLMAALSLNFSDQSLLCCYAPTEWLSEVLLHSSKSPQYLGLAHAHQSGFNHKPWVETSLAKMGIRIIPWRYFQRGSNIIPWFENNGVVRKCKSSGGTGLSIMSTENIDKINVNDGLLSVSEYLEPSIQLNVSGVVFQNGETNAWHPNVQLVGIPELIDKNLSYCGNDFGVVYDVIGKKGLEELEKMVKLTGKWLYAYGYRGTFGIDAVWYNDAIWLSEVNPRFQGSSQLGGEIGEKIAGNNIYYEHILAWLGSEAEKNPTLTEQAISQKKYALRTSQIVAHNLGEKKKSIFSGVENNNVEYKNGYIYGLPIYDTMIDYRAINFKMFFEENVWLSDGAIKTQIANIVKEVTDKYFVTLETE